MITRSVGEPDAERASCYDCAHLEAALSWWCTSKEAIKARGTTIPGVSKCPYWSPVKRAKWWHKWLPVAVLVNESCPTLGEIDER